MNLKIGNKELAVFVILVIIIFFIFFYAIFGITGVRTILAFALIFLLPFYLILDYFEIEREDKLFLATFIGIGLFPSLAYWLSLWFGSLKLGVLVSFIVFVLIGLAKKEKMNLIKLLQSLK